MKLYEAVTVIPPRAQFRRESKFMSVWKTLITIGEKYYLPVECRSVNEASHLKQECGRRGLIAERRQKTVFIQGCAAAATVLGPDLLDQFKARKQQLEQGTFETHATH